jgi:hypothetical protein
LGKDELEVPITGMALEAPLDSAHRLTPPRLFRLKRVRSAVTCHAAGVIPEAAELVKAGFGLL